jgi:hypothetical protein
MDLGVIDGSLKKARESYKMAYKFFNVPTRQLQDRSLETIVSYYPDFALAVCNKKRCFLSQHGIYGLALPGVAVGDLIPGLAVPLDSSRGLGSGLSRY